MSGHNIGLQMHDAQTIIKDPGASGVITVNQNGLCNLVSTTTETRTLAIPTRQGVEFHLHAQTVGGTITLTVASAFTEDGATTFAFSEVGQHLALKSFQTSGGVYFWRKISDYTVGNLTATELGYLNGITPGTAAASKAVILDSAQGIAGLVAKSSSAAAITEARVLTIADSGGTFSVAKTTAYAITLPTPAQGMSFTFMVLDTGANIVTISDGAAHLNGIVSVNSVGTVMTGTTLSLASAGSLGDWVEFKGIDATHYLVRGACLAAADITIA